MRTSWSPLRSRTCVRLLSLPMLVLARSHTHISCARSHARTCSSSLPSASVVVDGHRPAPVRLVRDVGHMRPDRRRPSLLTCATWRGADRPSLLTTCGVSCRLCSASMRASSIYARRQWRACPSTRTATARSRRSRPRPWSFSRAPRLPARCSRRCARRSRSGTLKARRALLAARRSPAARSLQPPWGQNSILKHETGWRGQA